MPIDINALLQGRNPYGRAGGNISNLMAQAQANNARNIDPRIFNVGFGVRDTSMDENPTPISFQQNSGQNDWNFTGERLINGQRYLQLGDFFQNGRNLNEDDILKLVKDPSLIQYDELGGLITPDSNFIGLTPDDFMTNLVRGGIAAAGLGATAAGIGTAAFGTPDLTSLLGGGSSSAAGGGFGDPLQFLQPNAPGTFNTMLPDPFGGGSAFAGGGTAAAAGGGAGAAGAGAGAGTAGAVIPDTTTPTIAGLGNNAITNVAAGIGGTGTTAAAGTGGPLSFLSGITGGSGGVLGSGLSASNILQGVGLLNNLFGSGPGTSRGATNAGNAAAAAADPFANMRPEFQDELRRRFQSLISFDPSQIENDPAYQFQLRSGTEARNRAAAASGMYRSGNREMELTRFGQDLASNFTQQQFARNQAILQQLAGLAGANSGSPGGAAQALLSGFQGASTLQNNAMNNVFSWLTGGGQSGPAPIDRIWNWLTS